MNTIADTIQSLASTPILLVASDFDGTLADIAPSPDLAAADTRVLDALRRLAALPRTFVAVISGRAHSDLARLLSAAPGIALYGSYGAEDPEHRNELAPENARRLADLVAGCRQIAAKYAGSLVETKPLSAALHYRGVSRDRLQDVLGDINALALRFPDCPRVDGLEVSEFMLLHADKGSRLRLLRHRYGARRVLFLGDDSADEHAFAALEPTDVGVKVGTGVSSASWRIENPAQVAEILHALADARTRAITETREIPIEQHSLLADQRTAGLLGPDASIRWLCLPRLDSPSAFGSLLGGDELGVFRIGPAFTTAAPRQSYAGDSLIVRTSWPECDVVDYFDCGEGRPFQRAGRTDLIRVVYARSEVRVEFLPRMDFGQARTQIRVREEGLEVADWADPLCLYAPDVQWAVTESPAGPTATAVIPARESPYVFELRYGASSLRPATPEAVRRSRTAQYWSAWASSLRLPAIAAEDVKRSALTLRALQYGPSGAIAAAATTSLPAPIGGVRNWDYRYCWPRDASYAAQALLRLGNTGMPMKLLDWLCVVVDELSAPDQLRPIYSLAGRELGSEATLSHMPGYAGSQPVRISNAAAHQVQLDVFGPIVDTVAKLAESGAPVTPEYRHLADAMTRAVVARWEEPDHGIWEVRTAKRFHTHSRIMCWLALSRASTVAEIVLGSRRTDWDALAARVRQDTIDRAWNEQHRFFAGHLGGSEPDASVLVMALCGFLDARDDRFISTVAAVRRSLQHGDVLKRYRYEDGLPGIEGGFLLCTAWLIEALAQMGRVDEAVTLFDRYRALAGPTGLLPEQWDPVHATAMGNFPQAYSHIGLINCACTISDAMNGARPG